MITERNDAIIAAAAQGKPMADIAQDWHISRERVRQICKRVGLTALLLRNTKYDAARTTIATAPACYGIGAIALALHIDGELAKRFGARSRQGLNLQGERAGMAYAIREGVANREAIRVLREQGKTTTEIMSKLHLARGTVCRHLKRLGLNDRPGSYKR